MTHKPCRLRSRRIGLLILLSCLGILLSPLAYSEESTPQDVFERAKQATVGILENTQDPRTPELPGKLSVRGTGFHLHDADHRLSGYGPPGTPLISFFTAY